MTVGKFNINKPPTPPKGYKMKVAANKKKKK